ncbi:MAG: hypothetical protein F6J98_35410 [Moorea sp. SIO4G2]|nr:MULTISPECIES: hypothetical protein [Moorena]NEO17114.1 hypothetical protein [Moorena sp. SIO3E8]NEO65400.1 hypothetical protein [Moorena sp. SIO4G2]NEQ03686.1 hypothetical protein [Moorena sp. SIO3F7]
MNPHLPISPSPHTSLSPHLPTPLYLSLFPTPDSHFSFLNCSQDGKHN